MKEQVNLQELYKQWCKETKRNGAILVGGSIREFLDYVEERCITFKKTQDERSNTEKDRTDP